MIVRIQVRGDDGKYRQAYPSEFAEAALKEIVGFDRFDGWSWLRNRFSRFCLLQAAEYHLSHAKADAWIKRYQQIRGIE